MKKFPLLLKQMHLITVTLNQIHRPVVCFLRTLNVNKSKYSTKEKEKYVIVKALYEWKYYLTRHHFTLTNQKSVFMFDTRTSKIQKNQIQK